MASRRIPLALAWFAAGALCAGCGGASYSSEPPVVRVTGVTLEREAYLPVGKSERLVPTVLPDRAADPRVTWASNDERVATVTTAGIVTGVGPGTTMITVTTVDGYKMASCAVTVTLDHVAVSRVVVDSPTSSLTVGSPVTLTARLVPANATTRIVAWSADSDRVSLGAASGDHVTVTALREGPVRITATAADGGVEGSCDLTIVPVKVTGLSLSVAHLALRAGAPDGTSAPITARVEPPDATDPRVTWTTSDDAVATVATTAGHTATILAHRAGKATISATTHDGRFGASCDVDVTAADPPAVPVTGVSLDHAADALLSLEAGSPGTSDTLVATVAPADATNQHVTWTTSDRAVAALGATTGRAVKVTGVAPGTATITATTEDGARTASARVKVWLLDADIAASTAAALSPTDGTTYGTRGSEIAVGKLLYQGADGAFSPGDADGGILLNRYASGSTWTPAAVGDSVALAGLKAVVQARSFIGVPADRTQVTTPSVKVVVRAKARSGAPRVALWVQDRVVAVGPPLSGTPDTYTFDGVPGNARINVFDGGVEGSSMLVEAIRVEPSTTALPDTTPPADVSGVSLTATSAASLRLSWTNPADRDLAAVRITYGAPPVTVTVPAPATGLQVDGLALGAGYTFTLRAVDRSGNASDGVSVVRPGAPPLLDEVVTPGVDADLVDTVANAARGTLVSVAGSRLRYFARTRNAAANTHFKRVDGRFRFQEATIDPVNGATGATAFNPRAYVVIPGASTGLPSAGYRSVRVLVTAAQDFTVAQAGKTIGLVLLDGTPPPHGFTTGPRVLANVTLPAATPAGPAPVTVVVDGLPAGTDLKIGCDLKNLLLFRVRVEPSPRAPGAPAAWLQ
jgi:uncharacterized protein YjdB